MRARTIAPCIPSATVCVKLDLDVDETDPAETLAILGDGQGAGDASDVTPARGAIGPGEPILGDDVGDPDPAAGPQNARDLGHHLVLLGREVDDAVRDHDVDAGSSSGTASMSPSKKRTLVVPAWRAFSFARASISVVMSRP